MIGVFDASGSGQDAFNFYKDSTAFKVSNVKSLGIGSAFVGHLHFTDGHTGNVTVADVGDRPLIVIYLKDG